MSVEQSSPAELRKHNKFWFEDGSVVFASDDSLYFRLHRGILSLHSEVFRGMFTPPSQAEGNEMIEDCPVIHLQDSGDDLEQFFDLLYGGGKGSFFRLDEDVEFRVVRSMLTLSFKYEVQHIREEALRRLHVWYPSTLAGWDELHKSRKSAGHTGAFVDTGRDSIAAINLARKFNRPELLPIAFYQCSCMPLASLPKAVDYGGQESQPDREELSSDDLVKVLHGADELDKLIAPRLRTLIDFKSSPACQRGSLCREAVRSLTRPVSNVRVFTRESLLSWQDVELREALAPVSGYALCSTCRTDLDAKLSAQRNELWDQLGQIYGVEPWPLATEKDGSNGN